MNTHSVIAEADLLLEAPASYEVHRQQQTNQRRVGTGVRAAANVALDFVPGGSMVGMAAGAAAGTKRGRQFIDRLKKMTPQQVAKYLWVKDGTGDARYDVDDALTGMLSDTEKQRVEAAVRAALENPKYTDANVPAGFASRVALSAVGSDLGSIKRRLSGHR